MSAMVFSEAPGQFRMYASMTLNGLSFVWRLEAFDNKDTVIQRMMYGIFMFLGFKV
jgi:hypothetical protein